MDWLELISIGAGMYVLYAAFLLKGKGVLTKGIFVSSKVNPDRIRDREGFISAMFPIAVLMGLALIASGAIGMLIDKTTSFKMILPEDDAFQNAGLAQDLSKDIRAVEVK